MRNFVRLLIALVFIGLWFHLVDIEKAMYLIKGVEWNFVIVAVLVGLIRSFLRAFRLKILLSIISPISTWYAFGMSYISAAISTIFPTYIGGFSISYLLKNKLKTTYKKALAVVFLDFIVGVLFTIILAIIAVFYFYKKEILLSNYETQIQLVLFVLLVSGAVLLIVIYKKYALFIKGIFQRIKKSVLLFSKSQKILIRAVFLTIIVSLLMFLQSYLYFSALGLRPPILVFILAISIFNFLNLIPGVFAKIGQYETLGVLSLPYLLNIDKTAVFSTLLIQHIVNVSITLCAAAISIYFLKLELKFLKKLRYKS
jgi:uncharacterized protein (TIRG00374 family)